MATADTLSHYLQCLLNSPETLQFIYELMNFNVFVRQLPNRPLHQSHLCEAALCL